MLLLLRWRLAACSEMLKGPRGQKGRAGAECPEVYTRGLWGALGEVLRARGNRLFRASKDKKWQRDISHCE